MKLLRCILGGFRELSQDLKVRSIKEIDLNYSLQTPIKVRFPERFFLRSSWFTTKGRLFEITRMTIVSDTLYRVGNLHAGEFG